MKIEEFRKHLAAAPVSFRRKLRDYLRYPTERNACYITGYVSALEDARMFETGAFGYWLALIGRTEGEYDLCRGLIAEIDNPPVQEGEH